MTTKPPDPAAKPTPIPEHERYMPGDPIPVPHAVEANSESTWALFSEVPRLPEPDFLDTVPASLLEEQAANPAAALAPPKRSGG